MEERRKAAVATQDRYARPPYPRVYSTTPPVGVFQHRPSGEATRSVIVSIATSINSDTCLFWSSAVLSGVETITAGLGRKDYGHLDKMVFVNEVIETKKLRDWDVVFYTDQDTLFTGEDLYRFFDDLIRLSPAHPDDINVRRIRRGEAVAPLRFVSEPYCTAVWSLGDNDHCMKAFADLDDAIEQVQDKSKFTYLPHVNNTHGRARKGYLNAGVFMARVWAIKEVLEATPRYMSQFPYPGAPHLCDQSIYVGLYLDQRWEEAQLGLLAPHAATSKDVARVNQFGLHYGLIDIWDTKRASVLFMNYAPIVVRADAAQYGVNVTLELKGKTVFTYEPVSDSLIPLFRPIFRSTLNPASRVTERAVHYTHPSGVQRIPIAPSALSLTPRFMDYGPNEELTREFPALLHIADRDKEDRLRIAIPLTGWHLAMELVPRYRQRALDLVLSAQVEVMSNKDNVSRVTIGDHCRQWIEMFVEQSENLL